MRQHINADLAEKNTGNFKIMVEYFSRDAWVKKNQVKYQVAMDGNLVQVVEVSRFERVKWTMQN